MNRDSVMIDISNGKSCYPEVSGNFIRVRSRTEQNRTERKITLGDADEPNAPIRYNRRRGKLRQLRNYKGQLNGIRFYAML
jgi:hypothetical protein